MTTVTCLHVLTVCLVTYYHMMCVTLFYLFHSFHRKLQLPACLLCITLNMSEDITDENDGCVEWLSTHLICPQAGYISTGWPHSQVEPAVTAAAHCMHILTLCHTELVGSDLLQILPWPGVYMQGGRPTISHQQVTCAQASDGIIWPGSIPELMTALMVTCNTQHSVQGGVMSWEVWRGIIL